MKWLNPQHWIWAAICRWNDHRWFPAKEMRFTNPKLPHHRESIRVRVCRACGYCYSEDVDFALIVFERDLKLAEDGKLDLDIGAWEDAVRVLGGEVEDSV